MHLFRLHACVTRAALIPLLAVLALGRPADSQEAVLPPAESQPAAPVSEDPPQNAPSPQDVQQQTDSPKQVPQDLKSLSLEELMEIEVQTVVSASKYRQKLEDAPASVTIVTDDDIRKFGYRTLADILRSVRGMYTTYDRNYQYVGIRGFGRPGDYNTRILLMVDGHRLNDTVYSAAAIGTEFILDVDLIERVEVTRGPGSSLYGSNAFFGVVNVITRRSMKKGIAEVSAEAASGRAYKGRLTFGSASGQEQQGLLSYTKFTSDGERLYFPEYDQRNALADPRAANDGYADGGDGDRFRSAFASFSSGGLRLAAAGVERTKVIPTASYGTDFNDPGNYTIDKRAYLDVQYAHNASGGTEFLARGYADVYRFDGYYMYTGVPDPDQAYGFWYGGEVRVTGRPLNAHRVIIGAESEVQARQDQWHANWEDRRRSESWALYVQDEITVSPIFLLYAGIRHDQSSLYGGSTNPRLSAVIKPVERGTLKLMYGTAFRAPSVYEKWYEYSPSMQSNPGLQPETITTYELAYEHDFGKGLRAGLARYSYGIKNLITQTPDAVNNTSFQNVDRVDATGTEVEVQKAWASGVRGRLSYTNQKAVDATTDQLLTNAPEHLAKMNVTVPFAEERFVLGLEEQYTGVRNTEAGLRADAFFLTNLTLLGRNRQKTVEASVSVYNLLDEHYADPVSIDLVPLDTVQQDGRTFRFKLTYAF